VPPAVGWTLPGGRVLNTTRRGIPLVEEFQRSVVEKIAAVLDPNGPKFGEKPSGEKHDGPSIQ
jgi:hypothetical protein